MFDLSTCLHISCRTNLGEQCLRNTLPIVCNLTNGLYRGNRRTSLRHTLQFKGRSLRQVGSNMGPIVGDLRDATIGKPIWTVSTFSKSHTNMFG